jgi:pimeloyl-ACP methyl ester carboxylesterase
MEFARTTTAAGRTFVYADLGDPAAEPVVLVHGFPDTPASWQDTVDALGESHRVIVPYLRGYHPDTIVPGRRYGSRQIGQDLIDLLDALQIDSAHAAGHDWGASVVYHAADSAPARIKTLTAVAISHPRTITPSPQLLWGARHFVTLRVPTGTRLAKANDFAYIDTLIRRWAPNWSGPDRDQTLKDVKQCFRDPRVLDAALAYYRHSTPSRIGNLGQPALLVGGTADILPPAAFTASQQYFDKGCDLLIVDRAGHWPHREAAAQFHERLLSFLASS